MKVDKHKSYFIVNNIKVHWDFKLLPKGFEAMTLFGHVYDVRNKEDLLEFIESLYGKVMINHERIHMLQAETFKTRYLGFYIYYMWYWVKGLFKYGCKDHVSYRHIPFEKEAFWNETNFNYNKSKWQDYKEL